MRDLRFFSLRKRKLDQAEALLPFAEANLSLGSFPRLSRMGSGKNLLKFNLQSVLSCDKVHFISRMRENLESNIYGLALIEQC